MRASQHPGYRADVDGLRAVAVLSVLGFHGFPKYLPGGFIGVDIFFVISGFLISGIIYRSLEAGHFRYADFYARRIRRIFPALIAVLGISMLAGWLYLMPDEFKAIGKQVVAGAGFASNLLLWSEAGHFGYFDVSAQVNPLLHLWSLGIEEQFYLTWPFILVALYRRTRYFAVALTCLLAGSFAVSVALSVGHPTAAYYSPLSRFWELLVGAALAYVTMRAGEMESGRGRQLLAWCGLGLLVFALVATSQQSAFPGWWALPPTLGAACVIAARDTWVNRLLRFRPLVFVGLISYPLYLWHWVLLAMLRNHVDLEGEEAPREQRLIALALSFVLAWLTYSLIEKRIRSGRSAAGRPAVLLVSMTCVAAVGAAIYFSDGGAFRLAPEIRPLAAREAHLERLHYGRLYRSRSCFLDYDQSFRDIAPHCIDSGASREPLLILWGDSHAASLYPGLRSLQAKHGDFRIAQFTAGACPPVSVTTVEPAALTEHCRQFNRDAMRKIIDLKPAVVLLEGDWWLYCTGAGAERQQVLEGLKRAVRELEAAGVGRVVVFGNLPVWNRVQPRVAMSLWLESGSLPRHTTAHLNPDSLRVDELISQTIEQTGSAFISPIGELCQADGCLLLTEAKGGETVAWDSAHLSEDGSRLLVAGTIDRILN